MKRPEAPPFDAYPRDHRKRLQRRLAQRDWQDLLVREAGLSALREATLEPPPPPVQQVAAHRYLVQRNKDAVKRLIRVGVRDEGTLVDALGDWETALAGDDRFPVVFLGLVVTLDCNFLPRCLYCNQGWRPRTLTLDHYKALLREAAEPIPPYVYITGGEPLRMGAEVWGDDGIVAFATKLGSPVNINTNATLITPHVALRLVRVGTARLHISLDCADRDVQAGLFQGDRAGVDALWDGLYNIQIARELLRRDHPEIHFNCVLTARNLFQLPQLLQLLLKSRKVPPRGRPGDDRFGRDFAFHLIPVGGSENVLLRPTREEWKRFYEETWPEAEAVWDRYQGSLEVPEDERVSLVEFAPFANPYLRVKHGSSPDAYFARAAEGSYWEGALTDRCYVAPTQAYVLPDGSQHWCGAHAIRQSPALGSVTASTLRENIRGNIEALRDCPDESCMNCAGATCVINQGAERNLRQQVRDWLATPV